MEVMEEILLFCYRNSQNAKEKRCCFHYLKYGMSLSQFFPPFLLIVGAFRQDRCYFLGAMSPVATTSWKASSKAKIHLDALEMNGLITLSPIL